MMMIRTLHKTFAHFFHMYLSFRLRGFRMRAMDACAVM